MTAESTDHMGRAMFYRTTSRQLTAASSKDQGLNCRHLIYPTTLQYWQDQCCPYLRSCIDLSKVRLLATLLLSNSNRNNRSNHPVVPYDCIPVGSLVDSASAAAAFDTAASSFAAICAHTAVDACIDYSPAVFDGCVVGICA
jgi:hypothetical protein